MSIRQCGVMHMGSAVRAHASHQLARGVPVAGKREQLREDKRRLADVRAYFYPCSTLPELRD
jgi:phage terminase Nu1 subunit (DNA packaging protein)